MKVRMIVVTLVFALAAGVPAPAQQSSTPQSATQQAPSAENSGKTTSKAGCACCSQMKDQAKGDPSSKMTCCQGKSMDCCKKGSESAKDCCAGKKLCSAKNGKACCDKNMTACNQDGKGCCAGSSGCCSGGLQS